MSRQEYTLLADDEQICRNVRSISGHELCTVWPTKRALTWLLVLSSIGHLLWPIIWAMHLNSSNTNRPVDYCGAEKSLYAGLTYDVPTPFRDVSTFVHYNNIVADATWDSWVVEPGIVALPHHFVNGKMLPQAQSSPLDSDKGVYILSSYHSLHCLKQLRDSMIKLASGSQPPDDNGKTLDHNLHCFDFLRQDIICHADDTPRYTGLSKGEVPGMMQSRMCRSWDKMEDWARSHTACFRDMNQEVEGFPVLNHTTLCPNGYVYSADGSPTVPWVTGSGILRTTEDLENQSI